MIDRRDDTLRTAESMDALERLIPEGERGPSFEVNEVLVVKNYRFRVTKMTGEYGGAITMIPVGPTRPIERKGNPRRKAGR